MINEDVNQDSPVLAQSRPVSVGIEYRPDIDGLRAIAVSAVVIFHAFPTFLTGGFVGVDVFFVISGYLISSIIYTALNEGSFSFFQFYARRIRRIFPSLIVVLVACYTAGWYYLLPVAYKNLGAHIAAGTGFISNFLLYKEAGYFDEASDKKVLLHLWSLGIEEQFYIAWPVFVYVLWGKKIVFLTAIVSVTLSSFIINIIRVKQHAIQTFYWPTSRVWELLIGACLAFMLISTKDRFQKVKTRLDSHFIAPIFGEVSVTNGFLLWNVVSIVGTFLIVLPICFLTKASVFPGWWAVCPTVGTALLILSGPTAWINQKVLGSRLLVRIGVISYPLYLWHWPLLVFTRIAFGHQATNNATVIIVHLSIILAWLTHNFIDKPLRFGGFRIAKLAFLCISMTMIGLLGYQTYQRNGIPSRFPSIIQNVLNFTYDSDENYRMRTCCLVPEQDESHFGDCVSNLEKPTSTAVVLWGDSFAAHLYPGIVAVKANLRITQLTSTGCPPLIEYLIPNRLFCKQINSYILERISNERPNTVVLAASWTLYGDWESLTQTITYLRNAFVTDIYLVGSPPLWQDGLPTSLYNYFSQDALHRVPKRMHFGLNSYVEKLDAEMQTFATNAKINYISLYKMLCLSESCLTRSGETIDTLITFDTGHFTTAGSTFVVSRFPKSLLYSKKTIKHVEFQ